MFQIKDCPDGHSLGKEKSISQPQAKENSDSEYSDAESQETENPIEKLEDQLWDAGLTPGYIINVVDSSSSERMFSCTLELFEGLIHVESLGESKYEAKIIAAELMLKRLNEELSTLTGFLEDQAQCDETNTDPKEEYIENNNSVSLQASKSQETNVSKPFLPKV